MTLHCGDCLDVLPTLPDASVDMVFADLPYGVTRNKWDVMVALGPLWKELLRVGNSGCPFVFTASFVFGAHLYASQPKLFRYDMVWQKSMPTGWLNARIAPLRNHENILIFCRSKTPYTPQMTQNNRSMNPWKRGESSNYGPHRQPMKALGNKRYPLSVQYFDHCRTNGKLKKMHPTQKPVALLEWLIKTYSNPGDTVLDPTMGSGTTGVACVNTGRSFIGIEKDAGYFDVATKRIAEAQTVPQQGALAI